jgi:sugar phosphate isomerase/epimerase
VAARLATLAALATSCAAPQRPAPAAPGPIPDVSTKLGVQLYSVRAALEKDVPGTLAVVRQMGFTHVEIHKTFALSSAEFRAALDRAGLASPSMMAPFDRLGADLPGVIADAKALGARFVSCPWIPHEGTFDEADARRAIERFNSAGAALKAAGLRLVSHIHGYELAPLPGSTTGERLLDLILRETQPGTADFEMDVFYMTLGGADPVAYLEKFPGRFPLLHLKDMRPGTVVNHTGKTDPENTMAVGAGRIDFRRIIPAAEKQGAELYFIEDEGKGALDHLPQSLAHVRGLAR